MQQRLNGPEERVWNEAEISEMDPPVEPEIPEVVTRLPGIATQLIGERIRTMYATMIREPVPDDLLKLVRQLESKEGSE